MRPHLDYCDVIDDKIFNESWHKKLESAQYNVALAITGLFVALILRNSIRNWD